MALASMTGFARGSGDLEGETWTWEVKSVNGRGLDIRCRMPPGHDALEAPARALVAKVAKRGQISLNLQTNTSSRHQSIEINQDVLDELIGAASALMRDNIAIAPTADGLLGLRGVVETTEEPEDEAGRARREAAMLDSLTSVLEDFAANRMSEGSKLDTVLQDQIVTIAELVAEATELAATQPEAVRAKFEDKLKTLLGDRAELPEERLVQEAALLAVKADVREELDRLRAHVEAARELLAEPDAVGRRLDFLAQEFNRETNTLCAKSTDASLTKVGLNLKSAIEQFREQVQNIE